MDPTPAADTVRVHRVLAAPVATVWRVWTEPALAARWAWGREYDTVSIDLDCRPGGTWRQQIRNRTTGETFFFEGTFEAVEPMRKLVHTFHFRSDRGKDEGVSRVVIEFTDLGGRTAVTITHTQVAEEQRRDTEEGWEDVLGCVADVAAGAEAR